MRLTKGGGSFLARSRFPVQGYAFTTGWSSCRGRPPWYAHTLSLPGLHEHAPSAVGPDHRYLDIPGSDELAEEHGLVDMVRVRNLRMKSGDHRGSVHHTSPCCVSWDVAHAHPSNGRVGPGVRAASTRVAGDADGRAADVDDVVCMDALACHETSTTSFPTSSRRQAAMWHM